MRRLLCLGLLLLGVLPALASASSRSDPNDPAWPSEWGPRLTRASDLWNVTTGSPGIVIAVVDTGLTPMPTELTQVVPGFDVVGNDTSTGDDNGHGTWVSSVVGALGNNGVGIAGYCWHCSIMPVRVAQGRNGGALASSIASGIRWAVDHGARIVNVSLVSNGYDYGELGAIEYAQDHGVLVIAAAGNTGQSIPMYPGAYPGVLAVAGTDETDTLDDWSTSGSWVSLAAPGCEMVMDPNAGPAYGCGSSFAPPAVSGIVGLLLSLDPGLTANQVTSALLATAHPVAGIAGGEVDAWAAANYLGLVPASPPPPAATTTVAPAALPTSSRQVQLTDGVVRRKAVVRLQLAAGPLYLQLIGRAVDADCSMSMRSNGTLFVDIPGEKVVRSLAATVKAGTYDVTISCRSARAKPYSLDATGMFPN
ncbi:MAG TPA: S8 family serine peptidase [Gaiellaceae bacterium]